MESTGRVLRRRLTPAERDEKLKRKQTEKCEPDAAEVKRARILRPFIKYNGKVNYYTEMIDIAMISDELLKKAESSTDLLIVGFDLEWPFSFVTGTERTAVAQISIDLKNCYILHVSKFKNLPKGLSEFLIHPNVRITGNNIKNDVRKLARDFPGFDGDKMVENCIDLGVLANSILPTKQRWSLEKLVNHLLNLRISKDKKIRNSSWNKIPLSTAQQKYAALDAYASLLLYHTLKDKEKELNVEKSQNDQNIMNK
ncbi:unnamed protein product [Phaedon cochleariae]|uniref:3'-5' exonuclease n=1 Tax=Phaedon cochleariae TaxID=80249 RepID=A0A9N9SB92_PHACE|nr:unnamed protein product [Phaedon cochleariae]